MKITVYTIKNFIFWYLLPSISRIGCSLPPNNGFISYFILDHEPAFVNSDQTYFLCFSEMFRRLPGHPEKSNRECLPLPALGFHSIFPSRARLHKKHRNSFPVAVSFHLTPKYTASMPHGAHA